MLWEWLAPKLRQRGVGLVGCVLVFALVLGGGLLGTQATGAVVRLQDGGAWLANLAQGSVTWVNGYAGQAGKTVPIGSLSSPFQVVQRPDGAYAVDENGRATLIDGARLQASERPRRLSSGVRILANQAATWMLDTGQKQVQRLSPDNLEPLGQAVPVEGVTEAVIDDEGYLWAAVPSQGVVVRIGDGAVGRTEVGRAGEVLTVAADEQGEHVVAVNTTAGSTFSLHGDDEARSFAPLPAGSGTPELYVDVAHDGRLLIGLDGRAVVVPAHGEGRAASLPAGTEVDQVEIVSGTGYLVDRSSGRLLRVDLGSGASQELPNVGGDDLGDVVAHGNLLYLNDSGGNQVKVVQTDGTIVPIKKYRPGQKPSPNTPATGSPATPSRNPERSPSANDRKTDKKNNRDDATETTDADDSRPRPTNPAGGRPTSNDTTPAGTPVGDDDASPTPVGKPSPPAASPTVTPTEDPTEEPAGPPEAPVIAGLTAEDGQALVEWREAATRGADVTGYSIAVDNQTVQEVGPGERSFRLTGLKNGQNYGVQVRALSAEGEGDLSRIRYVTPSADLPGTPGGVAAQPLDTQIRVTWTAAEAGRSPVAGYTVTAIAPDGGRTTATADGLQATVSGLTNGSGYLIEVSARSAGGTGEPGRPADGRPGSAGAPAVPSGAPGPVPVQAPKNGTGSSEITWTAAPDGGSPVTGYEVQVGNGQAQPVGKILTYTAKNLTNGADTVIRVRAVNKNGSGPWTSVTAHPELARISFYQCQSLAVRDIWMLNKTTNCNNAQATRWEAATLIFEPPATQQDGTVQMVRCQKTTARAIVRRQVAGGCPSGWESNAGVAFWAWTAQHAGATQVFEYHYASAGDQGGYYYAPAGKNPPSGFSRTGTSFWI